MATENNNVYSNMSASELSALLLKGSPLSTSDAGFCSGSSENGDDMLMDHPRSPTDSSEDSIEVKVTQIALPKNKRKSTEPLRLISDTDLGPIKKRIRYNEEKFHSTVVKIEENHQCTDTKSHFRPWAAPQSEDESSQHMTVAITPNPAEVFVRHPGVTTLHRAPDMLSHSHYIQDQPLALVSKKTPIAKHQSINDEASTSSSNLYTIDNNHDDQHDQTNDSNEITEMAEIMSNSLLQMHQQQQNQSSSSSQTSGPSRLSQQRNYKNMTRERRIEANARERTRVHTISAAFDTLRKSIPAYSNTQKLSKLSVLRISCSYILMLSRIAGLDYSEDQSEPPISECMDLLTKTIQTEGKLRKKKDE